MNFRPLRDLVLIRPRPQTDRTVGGLIIPETGQARSQEGEIVAVGPGFYNKKGEFVPTVAKVGSRVLFGKSVGLTIKVENEEMLIMRETEIIGILT